MKTFIRLPVGSNYLVVIACNRSLAKTEGATSTIGVFEGRFPGDEAQGGFGAGIDVHFAENILQMAANSIQTHTYPGGNQFVGMAFREQ
jgi:hypothetical protein